MKKDDVKLDGIDFSSENLDIHKLEEKFLDFEITKGDYIKININNYIKSLNNKVKYFFVITTFMMVFLVTNLIFLFKQVYWGSEKKVIILELLVFLLTLIVVSLINFFKIESYRKKLKRSIKEELVNFQFLITMDKIFYKLNGILKTYDILAVENLHSDENFLNIHLKAESIVIPLSAFEDSKEATRYLAYINSIVNIKAVVKKVEEKKKRDNRLIKQILLINIILLILVLFSVVRLRNFKVQITNENCSMIEDGMGNNKPKPIENTGIASATNGSASINGVAEIEKANSENINPYNVVSYISKNAFKSNYDYSNENKEAKVALASYLEKVQNNKEKFIDSKEAGLKFINNPMNKSTLKGKNANYQLYFINMSSFESCVSFYSKNPTDTTNDCNNAIEGASAYLSQIASSGRFYNQLLEGLEGMVALNNLSKSSNKGCNETMNLQEEMSYTSTMNYLNEKYESLDIKNIGVIELGKNNLLYRYVMSDSELYKLYENGDLMKIGTL